MVRQAWIDAEQSIITTTELADDGTGEVRFGPGAEGTVVLAAVDGELALAPTAEVPESALAYTPADGDTLKPLTSSAARIVGAGGGAGAGALIVGMTAFSTPAGGEAHNLLSDDVRLSFRDDGRLPVVQERVGVGSFDGLEGETWRTLPGVGVSAGPAETVVIDGDQLRAAIGETRFAALGQLDGRGVALSMQAAPVAPRDVPQASVFAAHRDPDRLYAPQGSVIDWRAPYAQAPLGQQTVLELREPGLRGLAWTSGDDKPMIGPLDIADVDRACPRFADVHQVAVEADARVRAANPGLSARDLGTLIHREIADQVGKWPEIGVAVWAEQGILGGRDAEGSFLPLGASRIDVLEDAGRGTVCVYDPKTGDRSMSREQMLRYWREAEKFRPGTTRVFVIPIFTKR